MSGTEPKTGKPIALSELIAFNEEIAALVRVGLPIEAGLGGPQLPKQIRQITGRFRAELEHGASVRQALDNCGAEFPPSYLALVEAGLRSNRLTDALVSAGDFARTLLALQHQVRAALVYPVMISAIAYGFFLLLVSELVPRVISLLKMSGGTPQRFLSALQFLSRSLVYWGPAVPAVLLLLALLMGLIPIPFARRSAALAERIHLLPWVGRIVRDRQSAGFCQLLAILVDREVPLPLSLELAAASSGNRRLSEECQRIAAELRQGISLSESLKTAVAVPAFTRWMLASGHDQGGLAPVMATLADIYRRRAESQRQLFSISAPLILTVVIGGTAVAAYSLLVFLPMRDLFMQLMSGSQS
ncbi:MAG TPA: type II secretion system F family protein [Planctomycetaceae bacterium]|jgi:general secretion pathway protein F|nr:type II secretion system F family protein [Planctomycetaceae bacterium]